MSQAQSIFATSASRAVSLLGRTLLQFEMYCEEPASGA